MPLAFPIPNSTFLLSGRFWTTFRFNCRHFNGNSFFKIFEGFAFSSSLHHFHSIIIVTYQHQFLVILGLYAELY